MVPQNKTEIGVVWRALSGMGAEPGWRCIPIATRGAVSLRAGRQFPGNTEALLLGFARPFSRNSVAFPQGNGFRVEVADLDADGKYWLALIRQPTASLDLFTLMADDVSAALMSHGNVDEFGLFQHFLGRIRAWQSFMRTGESALSPEAELGLVGELACLAQLLESGLPAEIALDAWVGPKGGLRDFELGVGAIEVKSTLATTGFPAKIGSLEQLDDSMRQPLFVCGCKFGLGVGGFTLTERVARLGVQLERAGVEVSDFHLALLHVGYLELHADRYIRKFVDVACEFRLVDEMFPRLTPGTVPVGVRGARYDIDLDQVRGDVKTVTNVLSMLMGR